MNIDLIEESIDDLRQVGVAQPVILMAPSTWDEKVAILPGVPKANNLGRRYLLGCRVLFRTDVAPGLVYVMNPEDVP